MVPLLYIQTVSSSKWPAIFKYLPINKVLIVAEGPITWLGPVNTILWFVSVSKTWWLKFVKQDYVVRFTKKNMAGLKIKHFTMLVHDYP